jgi:RHS repeat-associated protein
LLKVTASGTTCLIAYDGNGNVCGLEDASNGTVASQYEYGPFGEVLRATGPMSRANPLRFSTKYQDDETDLLYYGYRYYSASTGRWLSRDPSEESGGLNLYGFVNNNSVDGADALGLLRWGDIVEAQRQLNAQVSAYKCCCDKATAITGVKITGTASGSTVTDTLTFSKIGCVETITIVDYFWWDCVTAQREYDADTSPNRPTGRQAWQDYGWHPGSNPETKSHTGSFIGGIYDNNHWNWQGAILYIYCSKEGHYHAKLAFSEPLEWTWGRGGWGSPHVGRGN